MKFILILTLSYKAGYAGMGGVAMQEFDTKKSCNDAGIEWVAKVKEELKWNSRSRHFYLCQPKG